MFSRHSRISDVIDSKRKLNGRNNSSGIIAEVINTISRVLVLAHNGIAANWISVFSAAVLIEKQCPATYEYLCTSEYAYGQCIIFARQNINIQSQELYYTIRNHISRFEIYPTHSTRYAYFGRFFIREISKRHSSTGLTINLSCNDQPLLSTKTRLAFAFLIFWNDLYTFFLRFVSAIMQFRH